MSLLKTIFFSVAINPATVAWSPASAASWILPLQLSQELVEGRIMNALDQATNVAARRARKRRVMLNLDEFLEKLTKTRALSYLQTKSSLGRVPAATVWYHTILC